MTWLPEPIFDRWMAELRGGMYVQDIGCLRRNGKDCCLGVLLDIIDPTKWEVTDRSSWYGEYSVLPWRELQEYDIFGVGPCDVRIYLNPGHVSLAVLNDMYGLSYQQIAAVCEYYSDQIIKKD